MKNLSKYTEPFVKINISELKKWSKKKEIIHAQQNRQFQKYMFFQKAFDLVYDNSISGDYFEFGCHKGRTFSFALAHARMRNMNMDFYAFDSFEGLPNVKNNLTQNDKFKYKALKTNINDFKGIVNKFSFYKKNIHLIPGFYEKSLNKVLVSKFKRKRVKASLINFDCDLEQSVDQALKFSLKFLQRGTILYCDDYFSSYKGNPKLGIPKVIKKNFKNSKFSIVEYCNVGFAAKSFIVY